MIKGNAKLRRYTTIYPKTVTTINSWDDYKRYGSKLLKQSNNSKLGKIVGKGAFLPTVYFDTSSSEVTYSNYQRLATVASGVTTVRPGSVIFNKQQKIALAGDNLKIGGYGPDKSIDAYGYEIKFTDLTATLTPITTTTTAAVNDSASVPVAAIDGIKNELSTASGIGIDKSGVAPTVNSGANGTGAGTLVLSATQNIESGATLAFANAGKVVTITGFVEVINAGTANQTFRFDTEKFLTES